MVTTHSPGPVASASINPRPVWWTVAGLGSKSMSHLAARSMKRGRFWAVGAWTKHLEDTLVHGDQLFISMVGNKALHTTKQKKFCFNHYLSCLCSKSVLKPGWWYTNPSEKYEFVSWDYDIPNIWENTNNQKLFPHKLADFLILFIIPSPY